MFKSLQNPDGLQTGDPLGGRIPIHRYAHMAKSDHNVFEPVDRVYNAAVCECLIYGQQPIRFERVGTYSFDASGISTKCQREVPRLRALSSSAQFEIEASEAPGRALSDLADY
jgi:hypothetical protein